MKSPEAQEPQATAAKPLLAKIVMAVALAVLAWAGWAAWRIVRDNPQDSEALTGDILYVAVPVVGYVIIRIVIDAAKSQE